MSYNWFIIILALLFIGCGEKDSNQVSQPPVGVEQEMSKFSVIRSQKGQTRWKLDAKTASFMESRQVKIKGVDMVVFGDKTGEKMIIKGEQGEVNQGTYDVKIKGNVDGVLIDGGRLMTNEIYWSESEKKIYTMPGSKVTIVYKDSIITGEELDVRMQLETVKLKNVTGVTKVEEKDHETSAD